MNAMNIEQAYLVEVAWEVCNQVGGIYTVIRSKVPTMREIWGDNYCLVGPYFPARASLEFEPCEDYSDVFGQAVLRLREQGVEAYYGYWLVSGRPKVVLINPYSSYGYLNDVKFRLWDHHGIGSNDHDELMNQVLGLSSLLRDYVNELARVNNGQKQIIAHFHEWMVGAAIPQLRRDGTDIHTVFTTHATLLGRYLAMNDPFFYDHLPFFDWLSEARNYNIEPQVQIERASAHGCDVFTTVSDVTGRECEHLLGRKPDLILPNGLNIERFTALHEFQVLHQKYKEQINEFVMGHFFQSYSFELDKTLYFFTSGRYEYKNKGFDLTLEALARLNHRMREENIDITVVMFFITKQPYYSINPAVLQSRAMMEEIQSNCESIIKGVGEKFFSATASSADQKLPDLNGFISDYWKLRLRRTLLAWKSKELPIVVTHNLIDDAHDDILGFVRRANLVNNQYDKVKVVYHPDFISPSNPLFGMEYGQFVRGCHLGVFPSYYEPWGYTPLESMASGVPSITSDLSGFGDYVLSNIQKPEDKGIYVVNRRGRNFHEAADQLADQMFSFVQLSRRERIMQRNKVESASEHFDWQNLGSYYDKAYRMVLGKGK